MSVSAPIKETIAALAPIVVGSPGIPNIYQRKVALMQELGEVGRGGKNPHLKNEYIRYQDLMDALRPLTAKHGIDVICEIADGPIGYVTLTNVDDPADQIVQRWAPTDLPKDQGGSYLIKYALMKLFLIGDGEDPDRDLGAANTNPPTPSRKTANPPVNPRPDRDPVAGGSGSPTWGEMRDVLTRLKGDGLLDRFLAEQKLEKVNGAMWTLLTPGNQLRLLEAANATILPF